MTQFSTSDLRTATASIRAVTLSSLIEEGIDALAHELDLLLVLQGRDQRGQSLRTCERRQTTAANTAVIDKPSRRHRAAPTAQQTFGPEQVVHLRRVQRILPGAVVGRQGFTAIREMVIADALQVALG